MKLFSYCVSVDISDIGTLNNPFNFVLTSDESSQCVDIIIMQDRIVEITEMLAIHTEIVLPASQSELTIVVTQNRTLLVISDDDMPTQEVCAQNSVQLVGAENGTEGRVEYCNNNQWGTVCSIGWDASDAAVVCRQLQILSGCCLIIKIV